MVLGGSRSSTRTDSFLPRLGIEYFIQFITDSSVSVYGSGSRRGSWKSLLEIMIRSRFIRN